MFASTLAMFFVQEQKVVAVDCDVDAPNLHLWLGEDEKWDKVEKISTNEYNITYPYNKCRCIFNSIPELFHFIFPFLLLIQFFFHHIKLL